MSDILIQCARNIIIQVWGGGGGLENLAQLVKPQKSEII